MPSAKKPIQTNGQAALETSAWRWAIIAAIVGGAFFLKAYLAIIALSALLAFLFHPMKLWFERRLKRPGLAVGLTTFASILLVAIPVIAVFAVAFAQTVQLVQDLRIHDVLVGQTDVQDQIISVSEQVNKYIEQFTGVNNAISQGGIVQFLQHTLPNVLKVVGASLFHIVSGLPSFITSLIIFLFVFTAMLSSGPTLIKLIRQLSPFSGRVNDHYASRIGTMAKAMVKGQLLIAIAQGFVSAGVLALVGLGSYFWLMALLFTLLSFIPLGAGIITIPLGLLLIAFGNVGGGILVLANHFLVVTNIDNYIRPLVVPESARLPAALTILGAFAGVSYFGFLGVIYGPVIMIVLTTTIEAYIEQKSQASED